MDIHICGGCQSKFTDMYKFINHKLSCNLSSASSLKQTATLIKEAKVISQQLNANKTAKKTSNTANFPADMGIWTETLARDSNSSSRKDKRHSPVVLPHCHAQNALQFTTSNSSEVSKQDVKVGSSKLFTVADTKIKDSNPSIQEISDSHKSSRRHVDISTDDIAVYVVSPKSFASSVKEQCDFIPQKNFQNNMTGTIIWADSCSMSHMGRNISNEQTADGTIASSINKKCENSTNSTYAIIGSEMQEQCSSVNGLASSQPAITSLKPKYPLDTDSTPSSDSSTPCPEDLEVRQISAAMLGHDRSQGEPHRQLKDASLNGITSTAEDYLGYDGNDSVKAENKSIDYVRNKAASAPIIKNEVHNRRRVSLEKRERLQGVSDDLLACSPYLDTLQVSRDNSNKIALKKTTQSISATIAPQICYKAIFTSPSSAGHRLAPTQAQQVTCAGNLSSTENSNMRSLDSLSRTQKNSKAILYKNISASARRSKQMVNIKPHHSAAAPKRKTERKLAFEKVQTHTLSVEVPDVKLCSQGETHIDKEHFETLTIDKREPTVLSSLSSENDPGKSGSEEKTYKCLASFENDLNSLNNSIKKQEETAFQNTNTKTYQQKSKEEPQLLHIIGLNTFNSKPEFGFMTQGSDTIELFSPMSTTLDENAVIMVYKTMDSNIQQVIAKNGESGVAESQSLQSVEACSLSDSSLGHGHNLTALQPNLTPHQPAFHHQVSDTDVYINIVPSDSADCQGPKLLFQNFVCSDPHLSQLIAISTGNSALGSSPGVYTVSQGAVAGSGEVAVQKLLDVKPKQPELLVEKEKFIMRPRKTTLRAVDKSVSEARGTNIAQKGKTSIPPVSTATKDLFSGAYNADGQVGKKNKYFICKFEKCRYTTIFYKDFQRHYRTHTGERPFECKDCGKRFNRSDKLKIHARWHAGSKPFKCHHCDYAAVEGGSLKKHMRIHTDERPFKCQICSYASRNSSQLIVHLRTHTGDAPFHCTTCTAKFKINSDLKRHMRIHTGEKPFKCDRCDYKSSNKGNLKTHVKINHSEENEIPCPKCEFVTSSKKRLREHAKLHDTKPLERCTLCGYTCTSRNALRTHTSIHNKDKPHHCSYCSYSTKQGGNLKKHIENLHLDKLRPSRHSSKARLANNTGRVRANIDRCEDRKVRGKSVSYRKLFECSDCGSSFVRADSLRCHLKQHCPDTSLGTNKELATFPQTNASQTGHPSNDAPFGYGCQGIQQIVAAASRIHEENLLSANMAGNTADQTKHVCSSSLFDNQASHPKPYDISVSSPNVVAGHPLPVYAPTDALINLISSNLKTDLIETGDGVDVSPPQLQGISEGSNRIHLPWEHQAYTMSARADDSSSSACFAPSCKSGDTAVPIAVDLKSMGSSSDGAKPKQATGTSRKGVCVKNGPRSQKRKKPHDLMRPPGSNASYVVSPMSAATNQTKQSYYPEVIFQEITSGVGQIMDELETAMLVTHQISDELGMEHTYNIRLLPTGPQDATQMSAISQFSIQPGPNLPYQPGATHIQIVLPVDTVLESSQPSSQVVGQIFPETLSLIEPQLLDSHSQPTMTNTMTRAASQLTSSQ